MGVRRKSIGLFLIGIGLMAGGCRQQKLPEGVLTRQQMTALLVDVYLAEARLSSYTIPNDSSFKLYRPFQDSLLKKMNISDSSVKKSYQYYFEHPKEFEMIYDAVIDTLSLREQKVKTGQLQ